MNKTELIEIVAKKGDFTKKEAEKAVNAFADAITEALAKGVLLGITRAHRFSSFQ